MTDEKCGARDCTPRVCDLPAGHDGAHEDSRYPIDHDWSTTHGPNAIAPAKPAPNPRAWAVATALAGDADWARWARGETMCPTTADEMRACGWAVAVHNDYRIGGEAHTFWLFTCGDKATCGEGRTDAIAIAKAFASANGIEPVPAPWDADAYRADAARRGVEPGPMPSLHGRTVNGLDWCVFDNAIEFRSGTVKWFMRGDELQVTHTVVPITREQWVEIGILATAAKRAMGT